MTTKRKVLPLQRLPLLPRTQLLLNILLKLVRGIERKSRYRFEVWPSFDQFLWGAEFGGTGLFEWGEWVLVFAENS